MKFSFSTNAFVRYSVFDAVKRISEAGYAGVELLADVPHLYATSVTDKALGELQTLLDSTGLQVANVNANTAVGYYGRDFWEPLFEPSLANPDSSLRKWRIDYSRRCIDMAAVLGSPCISVTSGRMVPGTPPEDALIVLKDSLRELVEYAAVRGVLIGMEYEPGLLVERVEELAQLIKELDSEWFGANLDLGHSCVLGEDPERVMTLLGAKVFHVHLEDIRSRKHYHLIPGLGDLDFERVLQVLRDHGYSGYVTVELYTYPHRPKEAAELALRHLQALPAGNRKE